MHADPPKAEEALDTNPRKRRRKSRFSTRPDAGADGAPAQLPKPFEPPTDPAPPVPAVAALRARVAATIAQATAQQQPPSQDAAQQPSQPPRPKRRRTRFSAAPEPATLPQPAPQPQPASQPQRAPAPPPRPARLQDGPPSVLDLKSIPVAPVSTLRINRATQQKRKLATLKVTSSDLIDTNPSRNPYYDPALSAQRSRPERKPLVFTEPGVHAARAKRLRDDAEAKRREADFQESLVKERQTSELPVLPPLEDDLRVGLVAEVPEVEWWDAPLIENFKPKESEEEGTNANTASIGGRDVETKEDISLREARITHYIHHPPPVIPSVPPKPPPVLPLMLTKKETKKLRRQRRLEQHKEQQEMIAVGLLPAPKPKVKLSNLMRVLASEATADPTKVEAEVRAQIEERRERHEAENQARKKSREERLEKASQKVEKDRDAGLFCAVYRISRMDSPHHRFKVDVNARQLGMTGVLVLFRDCNVVVVEGGQKAQRKFKKLMLRRIDWSKGESTEADDNDTGKSEGSEAVKAEESETVRKASCVLIWEGPISSPLFSTFRTANLPTEAACRGHFRKYRVEHYWDLCTQATPEGNQSLGVRQLE